MSHTALLPTIPVDVLVDAYSRGRFPMCHENGALYWHDPDPRAVIPIEKARPNARLRRLMRSGRFHVTRDQAFEAVIKACAFREETWIDDRLIASYCELHKAGYAHSIEVWEAGELVGGIYGIAIGGAFFGESMFNRVNNSGKVAFHSLMDHLRDQGFVLFDTQYANDFTVQLGAMEMPQATFRRSLARALLVRAEF